MSADTLPQLVAPHSDLTEELVLAAILTEAEGLRQALGILRGNDAVFYQPRHRSLFQAATRLAAAGQAVDPASIVWQLERDGRLGQFGETKHEAAAAIAELSLKVAGSGHVPTHCQELIEHHTRREIFKQARALMLQAYDAMQDPTELLASNQHMLNRLTDSLQSRRAVPVGSLVQQVIDELGQAVQRGSSLTGVPSGLSVLDKVTGGFQNEDLIIVAARPGMGKTSLALSIAPHAAGAGFAGGFFTLEMGNLQLVRKMVATESERTTSQILRGDLDGGLNEVAAIAAQVQDLYALPLYLDDSPGISISEMRTKAAKMKAEQSIRFLVCDYLQLMQGDTTGKGNREQEISSISRGLKLIAKELKIPVIALAQLSRSVESRGGEKKPMLSDLRESGAIEQDADMIIFPYRPEYYKIMEDELGNPTANTTELIIAKHRNGPLDNPVVRSDMSTGTYSDLSTDYHAPAPVAQASALKPLPASQFDEPDMPF